jgi:transcriptional regulator with XRE-family HTH domain
MKKGVNSMSETFQDRLNQALEIRDMKPVELSQRTGLSKARISQYTNGVYKAKQKALYLIARALNVSEAWLMGHDVPMERLICEKNASEVQLLELIQVTYGKEAVELLEHFIELNETGKEKAIDTLIDLCMIDKYTEK